MRLDHETVRLVHSGVAQASAWGEVGWQPLNGAWRGRVDSCASQLPGANLALEFQVRPRRPSEPSVVLLADTVCLLRLDHNQAHRGRLGTHVQSGVDLSLLEWLERDAAGSPPMTGEVSAQHVKIACMKGAVALGVNIDGVIWTDPPKGV